MPIINSDILLKLSITTGTAGNGLVQGNVNQSFGKYISTTPVVTGILGNLFADVSGDDNANSASSYRCVFVHNNHGSLTMLSTVAWVSAEVIGGANVFIGVDPTAQSAIGASASQAVNIANETLAPAGVTFSNPTVKSSGIVLGDIPAGHCRAIWIKRTATNSVALSNDGATIRVECDTAS